MRAAVTTKAIALNIDRVFPLEEIVAAHAYMEGNHAKGKLVVTV